MKRRLGKDSSVLTGDLAPLTLSFATYPVKKVKNSIQQLQKIRRTNFSSLRTNLRLLILTRSIRVSVCVLGSLRLLSLDTKEQNFNSDIFGILRHSHDFLTTYLSHQNQVFVRCIK